MSLVLYWACCSLDRDTCQQGSRLIRLSLKAERRFLPHSQCRVNWLERGFRPPFFCQPLTPAVMPVDIPHISEVGTKGN